jgi:hypothetical protein
LFFAETCSYYIAQADLKLPILLPQPPECWSAGITGILLHVWQVSLSHKSYYQGGRFETWGPCLLTIDAS